jgi:hypothetical protein
VLGRVCRGWSFVVSRTLWLNYLPVFLWKFPQSFHIYGSGSGWPTLTTYLQSFGYFRRFRSFDQAAGGGTRIDVLTFFSSFRFYRGELDVRPEVATVSYAVTENGVLCTCRPKKYMKIAFLSGTVQLESTYNTIFFESMVSIKGPGIRLHSTKASYTFLSICLIEDNRRPLLLGDGLHSECPGCQEKNV